MSRIILISLFGYAATVMGQFSFRGVAPEAYRGMIANLDVIDGYADFNLISDDQLLQETRIDNSGRFEFSGMALPTGGRFYRIRYRDPADCPEVCINFLRRHFVTFYAEAGDTIRIHDLALVDPQGPNATLNEVAFALDELNVERIKAKTVRAKMAIQSKRRALLLNYAGNNIVTDVFTIGQISPPDRPLDAMLALERRLDSDDRLAKSYLNTLRADIGALRVSAYRTEIWWLRTLLALTVIILISCAYGWWRTSQKLRSRLPTTSKVANSNRDVELSPKEEEVLVGISEGKSNKAIAASLFVSESTVKSHINSIYKKAGIGNRRQAMALAQKRRVSGGVVTNSTGV